LDRWNRKKRIPKW